MLKNIEEHVKPFFIYTFNIALPAYLLGIDSLLFSC